MSDISRLVVAWVSAQQRHFHNSTRGIATVEQRLTWEREAEEIIAQHDREIAANTLRAAAYAWQTGAWVSAPRKAGREADRIAAAQYACDWLRFRADEIEEGSNDK